MYAIKRPTKRNQNSLYNFVHNTSSLVQSESEWIMRDNDLMAIDGDQEDGWFNGWLEDTLKAISRTATTVSSHPSLLPQSRILIR